MCLVDASTRAQSTTGRAWRGTALGVVRPPVAPEPKPAPAPAAPPETTPSVVGSPIIPKMAALITGTGPARRIR